MQLSKYPYAQIAIGLYCVYFLISTIDQVYFNPNGPYYSEEAQGSIYASSPTELLDTFVKANRFLEQHGFQSAAPHASMLGKSGWITPDMVTLYYSGSYQGSAPFSFRLDILRSDKTLAPYAEVYASSQSRLDSQQEAARMFLQLFVSSMKSDLAATD